MNPRFVNNHQYIVIFGIVILPVIGWAGFTTVTDMKKEANMMKGSWSEI